MPVFSAGCVVGGEDLICDAHSTGHSHVLQLLQRFVSTYRSFSNYFSIRVSFLELLLGYGAFKICLFSTHKLPSLRIKINILIRLERWVRYLCDKQNDLNLCPRTHIKLGEAAPEKAQTGLPTIAYLVSPKEV